MADFAERKIAYNDDMEFKIPVDIRESDNLNFKGGSDDFHVRYRALTTLLPPAITAEKISKALPRSLSAPRLGVLSGLSNEVDLADPVNTDDAVVARRKDGLVLRLQAGSGFRKTKRRLRELHVSLENQKRTISAELTASVQSAASWKENPEWLWLLRILALIVMAIAILVTLLAGPLANPYLGIDENMVFIFYFNGYVTWIGTTCNVVYALEVLKCPLPFWKVASSGIYANVASIGLSLAFGFGVVFPLPYWPIVGGSVAVPVALTSALAMQPKTVLKDPLLKNKLNWMLIIMLVNVGSGFLYAFYVALFSSVPSWLQVVVAPLLPICKACVKHCCGYFARKMDNPDFRHGMALFPDLCGTCVSSIVFINVNSIDSFLLLLAIDTAINLKHCLVILSEVAKTQRVRHERIVRTLCLSQRGITDTALAVRELKQTTINSHLVEMCGDFFFSEVTESIVPLINGMAAWIVYYLPNCNRRWVTYMWQNTEDEFNQGMRYILLDCFVQLLLFFFLARYVYFKTNVPIVHVGLVIANRHKLLFTWLICGLASFYALLFIDHSGVDTSMQFAWLRPGFNSSQIVRLMAPCEL